MDLEELTAISPIDGRYRKNVAVLDEYFSEFAFMRYRMKVEIEYTLSLLGLLKNKAPDSNGQKKWREIYQKFMIDDASKISANDSTWDRTKSNVTRHDFKAIEYYMENKLDKLGYSNSLSFVHFGLTTYDVTVPAYGLALKEANQKIIIPAIEDINIKLEEIISKNRETVMMGRTHGQPAVPTTLGKELKVFLVRVEKLLNQIKNHQFEAKLNGAVGNFNALVAAYPKIDWIKFSDEFIESLGLIPNHFTTQILPYDNWLEYFFLLKLLNNVLIGFCQDMWRYISDDYFVQTPVASEVGSSTMPQKVNPIDFENAEGNLGVANALFEFYERKLPISRLQRDLSDSTVKRTFGVALGHSLFAYQNILAGLEKISPNNIKMEQDLENHWEVVAEGIQTILRAEGMPNAYEKLKELTRGKKITKEIIKSFISGLKVSLKTKDKLEKLSPKSYIGLASKLV